ncbi:MAG: signal recognition particle-docking protein FtsY [Rhodospirillales bacterium]|jgi:fused signal recognition particle receptor|nr:signal recognition particle-docking protein FtsY [Rhodospirillales bacterium]
MSWFDRLKSGLGRTTEKLSSGISDLFRSRKLDREALEELEELLIMADMGVTTATRLSGALAKNKFDKEVTSQEVREALAGEIATILEPAAKPLEIDTSHKPYIVLVCGVNGSGKTTTIGKMAKQFKDEGKSVMLAAGDTFRAAAIEQLQVWGERTGCPVIASEQGSDAASLVYGAVERAKAEAADVLMIDTAGRLQNKSNLMEELKKVVRVITKQDDTAPHAVMLVIDSTVGQNAHNQVEVFKEMVNVTGLVMTKLDGTAKGGVVVGLAEKFELPVYAVGVGEAVEDLHAFDAKVFANNLMGLESRPTD